MSEKADGVRAEATGETVGEAKWAALRELEQLVPGLDRESVRFQVLSEGERGLLGVGYVPAHVIAHAAGGTSATTDESEAASSAREFVTRIADAIGADVTVAAVEREGVVTVTCAGVDLGLLIGKHGQTIDAIQYLVNAIIYRGSTGDRKAIVVDAAGYRERRKATLDALAVRSAERATSSGQRVELEPMTAVERKVIHLRLKDFPGVTTSSEGTEPNRYVVIAPGG